MPTYTYRNTKTEETVEIQHSLAEFDAYPAKLGPDWVREISAPAIVGAVGEFHSRLDSGMRDVLKGIKKASGRGNTIKV